MVDLKKKAHVTWGLKKLRSVFLNISFYSKIHKDTQMEYLNGLKAEVKPIVIFSLIVYRCLFALCLVLLSVQL